MLSSGQLGADEYFVSEPTARQGITSHGRHEPLIILKHYGRHQPDNPPAVRS